MQQITLKDLYQQYKEEFNRTAVHPHPSELLALLLLQEKNKYQVVTNNTNEFYEYYKTNINKKIEQVIIDFAITKDEIIEYMIAKTTYHEADYEQNKIWFVFANGFSILQWGLIYHPEWSPEGLYDIFSNYWEKKSIPEHLIEKPKKKAKTNTSNQHVLPKKQYGY